MVKFFIDARCSVLVHDWNIAYSSVETSVLNQLLTRWIYLNDSKWFTQHTTQNEHENDLSAKTENRRVLCLIRRTQEIMKRKSLIRAHNRPRYRAFKTRTRVSRVFPETQISKINFLIFFWNGSQRETSNF